MTSTPIVPASDTFLGAIARAAMAMAYDDPFRFTTIGTGESVLAKRKIIRRDAEGCIYVHHWMRSDPDDFHDHPWQFVSLILRVGYWEVTPAGRQWRAPGSIAFHEAADRHRVELDPDRGVGPASLIITGPEIREWGFHTEAGFVKGREYRNRSRAVTP